MTLYGTILVLCFAIVALCGGCEFSLIPKGGVQVSPASSAPFPSGPSHDYIPLPNSVNVDWTDWHSWVPFLVTTLTLMAFYLGFKAWQRRWAPKC